MASFIFDGNIDTEGVAKLLDFLEESADDNDTIYLASDGGDLDMLFVIKDMVEKKISEGKTIDLVCYRTILSTAFLMAFQIPWTSVTINPGCIGMMHYVDFTSSYQSTKDKKHINHMIRNFVDFYNKEMLNWCKELGMPKEKIDLIREGKDAYFAQNELLELLSKDYVLLENNKS